MSNFDVGSNTLDVGNFDYYTPHEFYTNQNIGNAISRKDFSVMHINIRSLSANYDNMLTLLADLQHNFSVIGLSETRIIVNTQQITNTSIPGYEFLSQPTMYHAG